MTDLADERIDTEVYEAAEDSHLLAGVAAGQVKRDDLVLDLGTGSGYVGGTIREETGARVIGADLNPHACRRARENGLETVRGDLLDPFREDVFDVVAFNPPYLPRDPEIEWDDWFEVAVTGGETGRETIERFLDALPRVLALKGFALVLVSSLTGVEEVVEYADSRGFAAVALEDATFPGETLSVLKFVR